MFSIADIPLCLHYTLVISHNSSPLYSLPKQLNLLLLLDSFRKEFVAYIYNYNNKDSSPHCVECNSANSQGLTTYVPNIDTNFPPSIFDFVQLASAGGKPHLVPTQQIYHWILTFDGMDRLFYFVFSVVLSHLFSWVKTCKLIFFLQLKCSPIWIVIQAQWAGVERDILFIHHLLQYLDDLKRTERKILLKWKYIYFWIM